jgi:predicted Zn-dependent protease
MTAAALLLLTIATLALGWVLSRPRRSAGRTAGSGSAPAPATRVALAGVPLLAIGLYLSLGRTEVSPPATHAPQSPVWADADTARPTGPAAVRTDRNREGAPGTSFDAALSATAAALAETTTARRQAATGAAAGAGGPDIDALLQRLERRLQAQPDDADGWLMLARSNASLNHHDAAAKAFTQAARLRPDDALLLADWADSLAMAQGGSARGEPTRLIERALALDPAQPKARVMAGTAALERGDHRQAQQHFEAARAAAPADSDLARALDRQLARLQPAADASRTR